MAQEQPAPASKTPWTKIFTAFKVALDMKKLVLAAAGIFLTWVGWWVLGWTFYNMRSMPKFDYNEKEAPAVLKAEWDHFQARRASWNLMHELAGAFDEKEPVLVDAADVATNAEEYKILFDWHDGYKRLNDPVVVTENQVQFPNLNPTKFTIAPVGGGDVKSLQGIKLTVRSIVEPTLAPARAGDGKAADKGPLVLLMGNLQVQVDGTGLDKLREYLNGALNVARIERDAEARGQSRALEIFKAHLVNPRVKKTGLMRVCPWEENRGPNPYLLVSDVVKTRGESLTKDGKLLSWIVEDQAPVLLEPLLKFLTPILYLFDQRAGAWERLYLVLVMLWTLAVWGFFGGAISRIAAVQVARNERIPLREAISFTRERWISYFAAPVFPMVLIGVLTLILMVFGWIGGIPWFIGDTIGGLLYPIVLVLGFIMTIVLVGLVGWPLMVATVSAEGTDSFDALSRSYSYIYQAPWQYLWSSFLALVYGVVLVFFIGFMASLMVFLGKWGVSSAVGLSSPDPKKDREPSYLFIYAPTSFGWRDLLISSNTRFVQERTTIAYDGRPTKRLEFTEEYEKELRPWEKTGAFLVSVWIYPVFLLVVGFGYSFFWSASTIVYFLMRKHVDDTEMDEVHVDEDDLEDPFTAPPPAAPPAAVASPGSKPGTVSLNVVDAPPASPTPPPTYTTNDGSPPASPPPQ